MVETKVLASTGLVFGTIAVLLFLTPFFLYSKNHNEIEKEGVIKIAGEIAFLHVAIVIVAIIFTSAIDSMMVREDFKPSNGLKYFFGTSGGSVPMWEYWMNKSTNITAGSVKDREVMQSFVVSMKYYSLFIYIACVAIPMAAMWKTVAEITNPKDPNDSGMYQTQLGKVQSGAIGFFGTTFVILFHVSLASIYVSIYTGSKFDFYSMITSAWHGILFGK